MVGAGINCRLFLNESESLPYPPFWASIRAMYKLIVLFGGAQSRTTFGKALRRIP